MKRAFLFLLPALLATCTPEGGHALLEEVSDQIRGRYVCQSITFDGRPVDLDGDGVSRSDLLTEFKGIDKSFSDEVVIRALDDFDRDGSIQLYIPMQDIYYSGFEGKYYLPQSSGNRLTIIFLYRLSRDGTLSFRADNHPGFITMTEDAFGNREHVDYDGTGGDRIVSLKNGILVARVNCVLYDYAEDGLVKGQAEYVYERVSFAY